jgi:hypothetical protein
MENLRSVLREVRARLADPGGDFVTAGWDDQSHALAELDRHIAAAEVHRVDRAALSLLFAPTGRLQEFSLANGWADDFLQLAERCDACLAASRSTL